VTADPTPSDNVLITIPISHFCEKARWALDRTGVPLPQPDDLPAPMAAKVRELRAHPAGDFALRMFRHERSG
jgi:glutathione S-transferase